MHRVLAAAIALVVALSCAAAARPAATFVLKGKGWGHGLGLAQYGAQGYAVKAGRGYAWILDHYYTDTTLGQAGVARVRVLLASRVSRISIGSAAAFKVTDANGAIYTLSAGTHVIGPNLQVRSANGQLRTLAGPVRFDPGTAVLRVSGNGYRGFLRMRKEGNAVSVVNDVQIEHYIKGVIAHEMPASWHPEALKAQAVIARTYGLVSRKTGQWFDLYDDTRSQVYDGVIAEDPRTSAAVDATAGEVVRSGSALAWTVYHSTSGGKTASREDEWGPPALPYLVGVPDEFDSISPHHVWGPNDAEVDCPGTGRDCVWSARALKRALGTLAPSSINDFVVTRRNGSSRVAETRLRGPSNATTMTAAELRAALRLRSTWFTIGVLRLTGAGSVRQGQARTLQALVRNQPNTRLQRKVGSGPWVDVRAVSGAVNVTVRPSRTTLYRLFSPAAATAPVKVTVTAASSRVASTAGEAASASAVTGTAAPGEVVQVQRRIDDGSWVTVAAALVDADGSWRASLFLAPGEYRAYMASAAGVGTPPTLALASE